jgi:hypothetical protein
MTTVGRWSPNKVRARVLDGTWVSTEELGGMVLLTPTSIAYTGTSATVGANGSVDFTAVSSLSLNGVFTGDFDNYMIVMRNTGNAVDNVVIRLRTGGGDATGTDYVDQGLYANGGSVTGFRQTRSYGYINANYNTQGLGTTVHVFGPYLSQPTAWRSVTEIDVSSAGIYDQAVTHSLSVSYDGFTVLYEGSPSSTFTGLVSVYGLVGA